MTILDVNDATATWMRAMLLITVAPILYLTLLRLMPGGAVVAAQPRRPHRETASPSPARR